jgi:prepilin-type N-terminal cleavage/methylation domain-containing protein
MIKGFTLIELSIVLVIIGLIVGGVLAGQSLIAAAGVRATISQIEKYNTAANTFRGKYGYLPGDIKDPDASSFGFQARGHFAGEGDGNGVIEGVAANAAGDNRGYAFAAGETLMFWVDLSTVNLIDGGFNTATPNTMPGSFITLVSQPSLIAYLPQAKLGGGNFIYVWSGGPNYNALGESNSINYYGLSAATQIATVNGCQWCLSSTPALSVQAAYSMDKKMDDGLPQSGNVMAFYSLGNGGTPEAWAGPSDTSKTAGSSTTCYDNGNVAGATQQYSVEINNGANVTCALSFRFQ